MTDAIDGRTVRTVSAFTVFGMLILSSGIALTNGCDFFQLAMWCQNKRDGSNTILGSLRLFLRSF